jgi:acetyl-CoA carboxylase carboxyltransferase component
VTDIREAVVRAQQGNLAKEGAKLERQNKLFVRDRLALLLEEGSFIEDSLLANALAPANDLPADGVEDHSPHRVCARPRAPDFLPR